MEVSPDRRDGLFCKHPKGVPVDKAPLGDKLGKTIFVDPVDGVTCIASSSWQGFFDCYNKMGEAGAALRAALALKTYGEKKQNFMGAIMQPSRENSRHYRDEHSHSKRCVILT
jgi:hypothetical protein